VVSLPAPCPSLPTSVSAWIKEIPHAPGGNGTTPANGGNGKYPLDSARAPAGRNGNGSVRLADHLISVVMPAYNEGHHIRRNLEETIRLFDRARCRFEIIAVDDGSTDDTRSEIQAVCARDERVILVAHDRNIGKGSALRAGCRVARGDFTVFLDSDLDLHPRQIAGLFRRMRDAGADVVVGSKWHARSRIRYPLQRKVISQIYRTILWLFFDLPLRDTQTGLKVFRTEALARAFPRLLCKRYALDVELLANIHRLGYRIIEAPVVLEFRRRNGFGRITCKDLLRTGIDTLAIFYRMYLRRYYDAPAEPAAEALPLMARELSGSGR